ncbi:hypothetical protein BHE74_00024614 [Ensete ventricosum]|nr:hypothetical protein BHE74_00024614 [Ensete ventricosum]
MRKQFGRATTGRSFGLSALGGRTALEELVVDGAEGLCAASRAMALVLRVSRFSLSSCSHAKEMVALSVADIYRKMSAKRSESKSSSDSGGRRGQQRCWLRLQCNFVAAGGIGCSKGATTIGRRWAAVCTAIVEEGSSGME